MTTTGFRTRLALVLLAAGLVAACGSTTPTPAPTQAPASEAVASPSETPAATPVPVATETTTATPLPSVAPTATPAATPTGTPAPTTRLAAAGSACSGAANFKSFYTDAVKALKFDVYCPILPSDWWGQRASYTTKNGGWLEVSYTNPRGYILDVVEGYPCGLKTDCSMINTGTGMSSGPELLGKIWFSDLGAYLYQLPALRGTAGTAGPVGTMYIAWSPQGTHRLYAALGMGMGRSGFSKLMKVVLKLG